MDLTSENKCPNFSQISYGNKCPHTSSILPVELFQHTPQRLPNDLCQHTSQVASGDKCLHTSQVTSGNKCPHAPQVASQEKCLFSTNSSAEHECLSSSQVTQSGKCLGQLKPSAEKSLYTCNSSTNKCLGQQKVNKNQCTAEDHNNINFLTKLSITVSASPKLSTDAANCIGEMEAILKVIDTAESTLIVTSYDYEVSDHFSQPPMYHFHYFYSQLVEMIIEYMILFSVQLKKDMSKLEYCLTKRTQSQNIIFIY